MKWIVLIISVVFQLSLAAQDEQLIVFTQPSDQLFLEETMPKLKAFSEKEEIQLFEMDALNGTPKNITTTPAIIYRNGNGTSTYAGRYTAFSTIQNFVRSARVIPQSDETLNKPNTLVAKKGKMKIAAALKITAIQSEDVAINESEFMESAQKGIRQGLADFENEINAQLQRTDRIFYLDFHPYFVDSDSLILSLELYAQFSCIDPIYQSANQKIAGTDVVTVFEEAAKVMRSEIFKSLNTSTIGDAYASLDSSIKEMELTAYNIPEPKQNAFQYQDVDANRAISRQWVFKSSVNKKLPILQFNFMEPLSRYAGEIKKIDGDITLNATGTIGDGSFTAVMKSLTMGEESFDKKVLKEYVKARSNPSATFKVNKIISGEALQWSNTSTVTLEGTMELMKKKRPITVMANLTPYVDSEGNETLLVQANWSMNITDGWKIKGPDGPDPAKKTLEFSLNVLMQPN